MARSDPEPSPAFGAYARRYLAYSRQVHTEATHRTRRSLVEGRLMPFFGERPIDGIAPADVAALLDAHDDVGPATRNRILGALSALLEHARRAGCVERNVAAGFPRAREAVHPLPLVSLEEQAKLLRALPRGRRLVFLAALDTGARIGELLRLGWRDVDEGRGALVLRRTKAGSPRVVRMSRRLCRALSLVRACGRPQSGALVFAEAVGGDGALQWRWRRGFKEAAAAIGHADLRVHDLRHLAAINLVRAGVDLPTVQAHLGHRHLISTLRYAAYADETASGRAARALDRLHGRGDP